MGDQADALRALVKNHLAEAGLATRPRDTYTVAVTSGKGGVGKTSIAVNLAVVLARSGRSVRLVDADFGLANAEVLFGVSPDHHMADVLSRRVDAREAWFEVEPGLRLLSSGSGLEGLANLSACDCAALLREVMDSASNGDVVIVDTAPGIDESVVSVLAFADEVLLVTTPEPTSIADCYAAAKVLTWHSPDARITLVVNGCASPAQAASVAKGLETICLNFIGRGFQSCEYLPWDAAVGRAVREQRPFTARPGRSSIDAWLRRLAIKIDERSRRSA